MIRSRILRPRRHQRLRGQLRLFGPPWFSHRPSDAELLARIIAGAQAVLEAIDRAAGIDDMHDDGAPLAQPT